MEFRIDMTPLPGTLFPLPPYTRSQTITLGFAVMYARSEGAEVEIWARVLVFFQAEDGIRDYTVTGVQTCALPIFEKYGVELIGAKLHAIKKAEDRELFK